MRPIIIHAVTALLLGGVSAPAAAQATAARDSTVAGAAPRRIGSWTSDRRSFAVGDIIKVVVDEYALATANKGTVSEASRERRMGLAAEPPAPSGSAMDPIAGTIASTDHGASRSSGQATRGTRYVGEIPVRVIAVTPEGLLQVRGTKVIDIDRARQEMTLTGLLRPQDIDARDVAVSAAVADARLLYTSKGLDNPRSGIIGRIVGLLWP
jgi:flagellar L-ring protein precursor FlgH